MLSIEEIENAAAMMREAGTPEASVQQFIEASKQAMQIQADLMGVQNGTTAIEGSVLPKEDAAAIGGLLENLEALGEANQARQLQNEIAEFAALHGDKPDVEVFIGDQVHSMKLLSCERDAETFQIRLEAPPVTAGERGPTLFASRSGPYAGGDNGEGYYLESLRFDSSDLDVSAGDATGVFTGNTFSFDGMSAVASSDQKPMQMRVELACI